jgi:hypothetical protein
MVCLVFVGGWILAHRVGHGPLVRRQGHHPLGLRLCCSWLTRCVVQMEIEIPPTLREFSQYMSRNERYALEWVRSKPVFRLVLSLACVLNLEF